MSEEQKPTEINEISYGQIAYEEWCRHVTYLCTPWDELGSGTQDAWNNAVYAAATHLLARASLIA